MKYYLILFCSFNILVGLGQSSIKNSKYKMSIVDPIYSNLNYHNCGDTILLNIGDLQDIEYLDISNPLISTFPDNFKKLSRLKILRVMDNFTIKKIPSSICELKNLEILSLARCSLIKELPQGIGQIKSLSFLDLSGCYNLKSLPEEIGELKNLEYLYLSRSSISKLPKSIGGLKSLKFISLWGTQVSEKELRKLKKMLPNTIIDF